MEKFSSDDRNRMLWLSTGPKRMSPWDWDVRHERIRKLGLATAELAKFRKTLRSGTIIPEAYVVRLTEKGKEVAGGLRHKEFPVEQQKAEG